MQSSTSLSRISLSAEISRRQFTIDRYGYLPYIVTTQLDQSEPTAIKGGILCVLMGLSGTIEIVVGVGLLKFEDY